MNYIFISFTIYSPAYIIYSYTYTMIYSYSYTIQSYTSFSHLGIGIGRLDSIVCCCEDHFVLRFCFLLLSPENRIYLYFVNYLMVVIIYIIIYHYIKYIIYNHKTYTCYSNDNMCSTSHVRTYSYHYCYCYSKLSKLYLLLIMLLLLLQ